MKLRLGILLTLLFFILILISSKKLRNSIETVNISKPNIVYILADDLGYGDVSCYGQQQFSTPNIDKLASEGMLFTQHYSGSTVCAPSRSSLMTGLHTGHTPIRGNFSMPNGQLPLPEESFTLAEMLKEMGYVTDGFGKWGLGNIGSEGDPLKQGFDTFFGYHDQRLAHHYYPNYLWDDDEVFVLEGNKGLSKKNYGPSIIHERALTFIEKNKEHPFFLYYPSVIPHAELFAPEHYLETFKENIKEEDEYEGVDKGDDYKKGRYGSQKYPRAAFAAMIALLDEQVGEIMEKLKELGLEENTIVIFTSDNGPHKEGGADPIFFDSNGKFKGFKRDLYEGGIRVPMLLKWPARVKPNQTSEHISAFWDIMPTIADIIDYNLLTATDGISFLNALTGREKQTEHETLYWEFHELEGRRALRKAEWKLIQYNVAEGGDYELYSLSEDPEESKNRAADFPEKVEKLTELMIKSRTESKYFNFKKRK